MQEIQKKTRILFVVNAEWYFYLHWLFLAKSLLDMGYEVVIAACVERGYDSIIKEYGIRFIPLLFLQRRSTNWYQEIACLKELYNLYISEKPDLVCHITIKPVIYGSVIAKITGIKKVINLISGLGYTYLMRGVRGLFFRVATLLAYKLAFSGKLVRIIFLNHDDESEFIKWGIVSQKKSAVIYCPGIDIDKFKPTHQASNGIPILLLASRFLWDKGIAELIEAVRQLKLLCVEFKVVLVGAPDDENPTSIPVNILKGWESEGLVECWGFRKDMPEVLRMADIAVLPSYREGMPRFLVEAAATGLSIVTTDVPGCREVVRNGVNGFLVPVKNVEKLVEALLILIKDADLRRSMGERGREIAVNEFSVEYVIQQTLSVYNDLLSR
ncbi:MAG TPA: glycosyltransferase family 4 protein [Syntrophorhabdaceae bacterium]|nr:glycosyltransferase family 4 protein [Syntrophorhabdaceae bacterium]